MADLTSIAGELYGDMVKAVADVAEDTLAIDAELHSDLERLLLETVRSRITCGDSISIRGWKERIS